MGIIDERFIGGLQAHTAGKLLTQLVSWAGTIYALRNLDSEALGLFAVSVAILHYGLIVYDGGVTDSLVAHPPSSASARRAVFTIVTAVGSVLGLVMAVAGLAVGAWLNNVEVVPMVAVMGGVMAVSSFSVLPAADLTRRMAFGRLAAIMSFQALASVATTVTGVAPGAGAWAMVAGPGAGVLVRAVMLNLACPRPFAAHPADHPRGRTCGWAAS